MARDDFSRPVLLHVCKDGTLSFRYRWQPIFNGAALPFFSVQSCTEAEAMLTLLGTRQINDHPLMPGAPWLAVRPWDGKVEDIGALTKKAADFYRKLNPE